jgi:hypothetical protein
MVFFGAWMELLKGGKVKHEFELRKILVGLSAIMRTDPSQIPPEVQQGLPQIITPFFTDLVSKMVSKREEMAKAEEEDLQDKEKKLSKLNGATGNNDAVEGEDPEDEGEAVEDDGNEDFADEDDDSEDGDFELEGGDMALYDSVLDDVDELTYTKETIEGLKNTN